MADLIILIPMAYIAILSIPLVITDLREHRLPNPMTISVIAITFLFLIVQGFISSDWARPLSGFVAGGITFYAGYLLAKLDAIGMGDVKLLTSLNAIAGFFSPMLVIISLTAGLVIATLASLILYLLKKMTMKSLLPLGPYLLLGFFLSVGPNAFFLTAEVLS